MNGFNLGRYWPTAGPQVTLYVPAGTIKPHPQPNILLLVELENAPCGSNGGSCSVELTDTYNISGKCFKMQNAKHVQLEKKMETNGVLKDRRSL